MTKPQKFTDPENAKGVPIINKGREIWDKLVSPSAENEEANLSRLLSGTLLILIVLGGLTVLEYSLRRGFDFNSVIFSVTAVGLLFFAYLFNRFVHFKGAVVITLATITLAVFATLWLNRSSTNDFYILYYLIVPILIAEFFLPITGYTMAALAILGGILFFQSFNPVVKDIASLMAMFSGVVGLAGYYRKKLEHARGEKLVSIERRHARQMELLNSITHAALQMPDTHQALQVLADRLSHLLDADGAFITLWDEERQTVIPTTAYGDFRDTYQKTIIEPDERTLTASVLRAKHPLAVEDVLNTPYMSPRLAKGVPTRSALALPLIAHEKKLGAVIISYNKTHHFTEEEIHLGEQASAQIALAIYKGHLIDVSMRQVGQLELLSEVGRDIANSLIENEILERTIDALVKRFGYAEAAISLLVDETVLEIFAISGTEDFGYQVGYRQDIGKGIIGHVAETKAPHIAGDVSQDPYYYSTASRKGSALGVPMLDQENLLGVIYVESTQDGHFKADDVRTLQTLANLVANSLQKARLYERTQEHLQAMTTLQSVSQVVSSSLERDEILNNVVRLLKETFGFTYISIYLLHEDHLRLGVQVGYPDETIIYDIHVSSGVAGRTVLSKQTQFVPNVSKEPSFLRAAYEVRSEICVPLLKDGVVLGVLNVESDNRTPLNENDLHLLNAIAGPITIAIDNARLHAQVKAMAMTDAVSGLFNRHAFEEMLTTEIQRAIRYGHQLSLIIFDIDSFKEYNDTWGHPAGDERLRGTANLIRASQRKYDIAARYGGDEFAIILPNTDKEGARQFAKRLLDAARNSTAEKPTDGKGIPGYTLSLGYATFPHDGDTLAALLLAADQAELMAKRLGKNQIASAGNFKQP